MKEISQEIVHKKARVDVLWNRREMNTENDEHLQIWIWLFMENYDFAYHARGMLSLSVYELTFA